MTHNVLFHDNSVFGGLRNRVGNQAPTNIRIKHSLNFLKNQSIDIFALQEVTPSFYRAIKKEKLFQSYHIAHTFNDHQLKQISYMFIEPFGQIVLSKFPIIYKKVIHLKYSKLDRKALLVKVKIFDKTIDLVNVHLDSLEQDSDIRIEQLKEIFNLLFISENAIVLGDFNFHDQQQKENRFIPEDYEDVWIKLKNERPGYTFIDEKQRKRLDRILIKSQFMTPLSIELKTENFVYEGDNYQISDHLAVKIKLTL